MKEITTKVYEFDELNEEAKETAREWFREGALDFDWWDFVYDDAANIGLKITSFDLDRNRHAKGSFTTSASEVAANIIQEHGKDCETFKTASDFLTQYNAISEDEDGEKDTDTVDDLEEEFLKSLLEDYSIMLQHEYEYRLSDEAVDEDIRANEYTFTDTGKSFG